MKGKIGAIVLGLFMVIGLACLFKCTERVPAGYVGVVYSASNGVTDEVLSQGWHVVSPMKKVTLYSIGIEQSYLTADKKGDSDKDESFNVPTQDGKVVSVELEFSYRFDADKVADTFVQFKGRSGEDIKDSFIKPKIMAWTQEVSATYPVTDIFGDKRTEINAKLDSYLKEKFATYSIIIDTVNFTNIAVDDETAASIQKKVAAQQELELANIEAQTAKVQAEKDKEVALIAATQAKEVAQTKAEQDAIVAQGEANALKISAEAEAEANRIIAQSLTPELIEKIKLDRWNGDVPQVQGSSTPIINMGN